MKFTSIFYKASEVYIRGLPQIYKQTSGKYEVYFNILQSECSIYSRINLKADTNFCFVLDVILHLNFYSNKKISNTKLSLFNKLLTQY